MLHVSVLPSFSKFLERIIYNRLYDYSTNLHILCDNQFGFRKKHSTTLALIDLHAKISSAIDRGELEVGVFLDLSKAFDIVNHSILFVLLGEAQIWRPHSKPYKFLLLILKNNTAAENCTDIRLGQVVNLSIFYNSRNSWLQTFHGFDFSCRWPDSENHQYNGYVSSRAKIMCGVPQGSILGPLFFLLYINDTVYYHRVNNISIDIICR